MPPRVGVYPGVYASMPPWVGVYPGVYASLCTLPTHPGICTPYYTLGIPCTRPGVPHCCCGTRPSSLTALSRRVAELTFPVEAVTDTRFTVGHVSQVLLFTRFTVGQERPSQGPGAGGC